MKNLRDLGAAFSYFSIFPIPHADEAPGDDAIAWLPLVGLVVGALSGFAGYGMWLLTHSQIAAAITAWGLSIALSGAIHVDGFLDCCDGLFAMAPPQRRLEIMRDPHHGTYAIVGMAIIGVLWLYALVQIPPAMMPIVVGLAASFSRWGAASLRTPSAIIVGAAVFAVAVASQRGHWLGVAASAVLAWSVSLIVSLFAGRRLGGALNGDCYGAMIVVSEVGMLLAYPALASLR